MSAFGGVFRGPVEGVEDSDENGERGRIVGLDLESGVVRVQPASPTSDAEHPDDQARLAEQQRTAGASQAPGAAPVTRTGRSRPVIPPPVRDRRP